MWSLVLPPKNHSIIDTRSILKNKLNKDGEIVKNKVRLVAQGYCQEEGIELDEIFELVARLKSIQMMLAFACYHDFSVH